MKRHLAGMVALSLAVGCLPAPFLGNSPAVSGPRAAGVPDGASQNSVALTSHSTDSVTITGLFPSQAKVGDTITIAGTNFSDTAASNSVVFEGGVTATPTSADIDSLVVTVPASASSGLLRVDVGSQSSNRFYFGVTPVAGPVITGVYPSQAMPGSSVTVFGSGFSSVASENTVNFGTLEVTPSYANASSLIVTVPAEASTNQVWVRRGANSSNRLFFSVPITIAELFPNKATPGQELSIRGSGIGGAGVVSFSATNATYSVWTPTEILATVPSASSGALAVGSNGGYSSVPFEILRGNLASWIGSARLTRARSGANCFRVGKFVYAGGGFDGSSWLSTFERTDIKADGTLGTFQALAGLSLSHGAGSPGGATVRIKDYIYVVAGLDTSANNVNTVSRSQIDSNDRLGPFSAVSGVTLPAAVRGHSLQLIKGYLYAFGGYAASPISTVYRAQVNSDGTIGNFSASGNMTVARAWAPTRVIGNYVYAFGGSSTTCQANTSIERALINVDGTLGTWQSYAVTLPIPMASFGAAEINGRLYVFGGYKCSGYDAKGVYVSAVSGDDIGTFQDTYLPINSYSSGFPTIVIGSRLYSVGGYNGTSYINDFYEGVLQ